MAPEQGTRPAPSGGALPELDSPSTAPRGHGRIPALDGIRAIAVLAVMLFHSASSPLDGGYLGVDVFFVLSGFLIGGILLDSWTRARDLDLKRFWLRRARRLAPALLLLLAVLAVARLAVPQASADAWRAEILAALTYTTNWYEIASGSAYFSEFGLSSPLVHTWSLAIEEQFYIGFALVLLFLLPRLRVSRRLAVVLAGATIASATAMALAAGSSDGWAYFSTVSRVQALLIGAGLALLVRRDAAWSRPQADKGRERLGWLAAAAIVAMFLIPLGQASMYRGGFLLVAVLSAIVVWACLAPGRLATVLSWRPLVALGVISYGVYLWHWPIFLLLGTDRSETGLAIQLWAMVLTIAVAAISYVLVERPIRFGRFTRLTPTRQWVAYGAAAAVIAASLALPARTAAGASDLNWPSAEALPERISIGGDSTMLTLWQHSPRSRYPGMSVDASAKMGCGLVPVPLGTDTKVVDVEVCKQWLGQWREFFAKRDPEVAVVGAAFWDLFDRSIDGGRYAPGTTEFDEAYVAAVRSAIGEIGADGRIPVYVVGQACVRSERHGALNDADRSARADALVREAVSMSRNARFVDVRPWTCAADGSAVTLIGRQVIREDGVHWAKAGADRLWSQLLTQIADDRAAGSSAESDATS